MSLGRRQPGGAMPKRQAAGVQIKAERFRKNGVVIGSSYNSPELVNRVGYENVFDVGYGNFEIERCYFCADTSCQVKKIKMSPDTIVRLQQENLACSLILKYWKMLKKSERENNKDNQELKFLNRELRHYNSNQRKRDSVSRQYKTDLSLNQKYQEAIILDKVEKKRNELLRLEKHYENLIQKGHKKENELRNIQTRLLSLPVKREYQSAKFYGNKGLMDKAREQFEKEQEIKNLITPALKNDAKFIRERIVELKARIKEFAVKFPSLITKDEAQQRQLDASKLEGKGKRKCLFLVNLTESIISEIRMSEYTR